jgi:hypothetical protein
VHYYGAQQLHAHCSHVEVAIAMQSSASQALKLPLPILQYPIEASAPAITSCHDPGIIQEEDDDDLFTVGTQIPRVTSSSRNLKNKMSIHGVVKEEK